MSGSEWSRKYGPALSFSSGLRGSTLLHPTTTQILFEARKRWYVGDDQEQNKYNDPGRGNLA